MRINCNFYCEIVRNRWFINLHSGPEFGSNRGENKPIIRRDDHTYYALCAFEIYLKAKYSLVLRKKMYPDL